MVRIKWKADYGNYKTGQEFDVADIKKLQKHIEAGRIEVLKDKPEAAAAPKAETATIKAPEVHTRKTDKK